MKDIVKEIVINDGAQVEMTIFLSTTITLAVEDMRKNEHSKIFSIKSKNKEGLWWGSR